MLNSFLEREGVSEKDVGVWRGFVPGGGGGGCPTGGKCLFHCKKGMVNTQNRKE